MGRAFLSAGDVVLSTTEVFDFTFAQDRHGWRRRHRWSVIRVLDRLCHRVGRAPTIRQAVAVAAQDTAKIGLLRKGGVRHRLLKSLEK